MYPVCSWEANQHKIYNAHDRIMNRIHDAINDQSDEDLDKLFEEQKRIEKALEIIDGFEYNGIVYATWEDGLIVKDYIYAYNARH